MPNIRKTVTKKKRPHNKYYMLRKGAVVVIYAVLPNTSRTMRRIVRGGSVPTNYITSILQRTDMDLSDTEKAAADAVIADAKQYASKLDFGKVDQIVTDIKTAEKDTSLDSATKKTKIAEQMRKLLALTAVIDNAATAGVPVINDVLTQMVKDGAITEQKRKDIIASLESKGTLSNISGKAASALSGLSSSAASMTAAFGQWLAPAGLGASSKGDTPTENTVDILVYPKTHEYFGRKLDANEKPNSGDIVIYVNRPKFSSTMEGLRKQGATVEDMFANVLNELSLPEVHTAPRYRKTIRIRDSTAPAAAPAPVAAPVAENGADAAANSTKTQEEKEVVIGVQTKKRKTK